MKNKLSELLAVKDTKPILLKSGWKREELVFDQSVDGKLSSVGDFTYHFLGLYRYTQGSEVQYGLTVKRHNHAHSEGSLRNYDLFSIPKEMLERFEIWGFLSEDIQATITNRDLATEQAEKELLINRAAHARKFRQRRDDLVNVPDEMVCFKCKGVTKLPRSQIAKRAKIKFISVEEFLKNYQCQKCCPTKGRKKSTNLFNLTLPKELVCKCGNKVGASPSSIIVTAKRRNISPTEYVQGYQCQKCCPTIGRHLKRRKKKT